MSIICTVCVTFSEPGLQKITLRLRCYFRQPCTKRGTYCLQGLCILIIV